MTYLNVEGQGQIDISKIAIFSICYKLTCVISSKLAIVIAGCLLFVVRREYDKEIPQSQTADSPVAPRGRAAQPSRDTRKTN